MSVQQDPSGAVALLWVWRSLRFNQIVWSAYVQGKDGAAERELAYKTMLEPVHGFFARQAFKVASLASPGREGMYAYLGAALPEDQRETVVTEDAKYLLKSFTPLLPYIEKTLIELKMMDMTKV